MAISPYLQQYLDRGVLDASGNILKPGGINPATIVRATPSWFYSLPPQAQANLMGQSQELVRQAQQANATSTPPSLGLGHEQPQGGGNKSFDSELTGLYQSLFGRDPREAGIDYWEQQLNNPSSGVTLENLEQALISGAGAQDALWYEQNVLGQRPANQAPAGQAPVDKNPAGQAPADQGQQPLTNPFENVDFTSNLKTTYAGSTPFLDAYMRTRQASERLGPVSSMFKEFL